MFEDSNLLKCKSVAIIYIFFLFVIISITKGISFADEHNDTLKNESIKNGAEYKEEIKDGRYIYTNETVQYQRPGNNNIAYRSMISVRRTDGTTIYEEVDNCKVGRCAHLPLAFRIPIVVQKNYLVSHEDETPKWLVGMCNSDDPIEEELRLFTSDFDYNLRNTTLKFFEDRANLTTLYSDGSLIAIARRRIFFYTPNNDCIGNCWDRFLTAYKLVLNDTQFGFIPLFDKISSKIYLDEYYRLKFTLQTTPAPMLAALIASGDRPLLCSELSFIKNKFQIDPQCLKLWVEQLHGIGYPEIDLDECKEVSK